jgi:hypothetical protein
VSLGSTGTGKIKTESKVCVVVSTSIVTHLIRARLVKKGQILGEKCYPVLDIFSGSWDIQESCSIHNKQVKMCRRLMVEIWCGQMDLKIIRKEMLLQATSANELTQGECTQ